MFDIGRDPEEIEAERRAAEEMQRQIEQARKDSYTFGWENFFKHFMFTEVNFLLSRFIERCPDARPGGVYKNLDKTISKEAMEGIAIEWIVHRYGGPGRSTEIPSSLRPRATLSAAEKAGIDIGQDHWSMKDVVGFISEYQLTHLNEEEFSGFAKNDLEGFETLFNEYHGGAPIKARQLWEILSDLSYDFPTREEQAYVLKILMGMKLKKQGEITFSELLCILRRCVEDKKVDERKREHDLIVRSDMELDEIEGWLQIFEDAANSGYVIMADMKKLFEDIGLKWGMEDTDKFFKWLREVDEDSNGYIDFGEFSCLVSRMWAEDFAGIRKVSENRLKEAAREEALREASKRQPSKVSFKGDGHPGALDDDEDAPTSPLLRSRSKQTRRTWRDIKQGSKQTPLSEKAEQSLLDFERNGAIGVH